MFRLWDNFLMWLFLKIGKRYWNCIDIEEDTDGSVKSIKWYKEEDDEQSEVPGV